MDRSLERNGPNFTCYFDRYGRHVTHAAINSIVHFWKYIQAIDSWNKSTDGNKEIVDTYVRMFSLAGKGK